MHCKVVIRKAPNIEIFKCNSDGASRSNSGPNSGAYCVRNENGNLIFAEGRRLEDGYNINAEVVAFRMGLEHCIQHHYVPLIMETDPLMIKNIVDGGWSIPWSIVVEIEKIKH
ncbi:hypothetical protein T459_08740 [Capsicum annuum]|uniref:RNase H type-1 domain-containing protein n=1 Tax=Capsicum annuum TaxID=4072 RepID=A0A2G2ZXD9_CAPAN|nr:hypothetical protein T459_08740 [Capsicum annuum]